MAIALEFSNMMADAVTGGISESDWQGIAARVRTAHVALATKRSDGKLDFLAVPEAKALLAQSTEFAAAAAGRFDDVVLLGIGGSALGPLALRSALCAPAWNSLSAKERGGHPRFHVFDNVDPGTITATLGRLELERTLFIVTSKSGGTAETMSQYLIARDRVRSAGLHMKGHFVFITDPEKGALRPIARAEGIPALDIPPGVGGRFSVLTPVGVLPAALLGIDVHSLMSGAGAMATRCAEASLTANTAAVYAALQWLSDTRFGRTINVFMPYSDPLRDMAAWFVQLWAESLGKLRGETAVGPTPLPALGATDQHSQVQLFMQGPANKTVTFVTVKDRGTDLTIPGDPGDGPELSYLRGHSLAELIDVEQRATAGALAKRGRPNMTLVLDKVDPWHVGGLVMLLEIATAYAGELYNIDAFNQPGVELGKQFAYAMLGRADADAARREWETLPKADPRWRV